MTSTPEENPAVETRLGVVEAQLVAVQEGQRQIIARLDAMQHANDARMDNMQRDNSARIDAMERANDARFDALNSRIDRLFYTILGLGIAAIGTMIALDKVL